MPQATNNFQSTDGVTASFWTSDVRPIDFQELKADAHTDVCIVGGGIAGLTTAYLLLKARKTVFVLDDSAIGDGQTGRTSAHLASAIDDRFMDIESGLGEEASRIQFESHAAAIDLIEKISRDEGIDCEFKRVDGFLFRGPQDDAEYLEKELAAALRAGATVHRVNRIPVDGVESGTALKFERQAKFHPMKYLVGLCRAIERLGGAIHCSSFVNDVQGGDVAKGESCIAKCESGKTVTADAIVVATNVPSPINDWAGIYTKQAPYRSYVAAFRIPRGVVADALYWDTGDTSRTRLARPYHYVRTQRLAEDETHELLIVGGEDHKVGQIDSKHPDPFAELEQWTRKYFPSAEQIAWKWSGQVQEPSDGVAFIGLAPTAKPNIYVITGDSGMGLTHGTLGARLVTDLILGTPNSWRDLYDPSRKPTGAKMDFVAENLNAVKTFTDYITPSEVNSEDEIAAGEGALLRHGLKKLAVYRDEHGALHKCSSICTHLGCIVHWNPIEKTWDCPCHGSRFDPTGQRVVIGPAVKGLTREDR